MIDTLKAALSSGSAGGESEHPTLAEVGGCVDAWICYQQREQRPDGSEVCGGCGRVLRSAE